MSIPITETPILKGKDAKKFLERMKTARLRPVSKDDYDRAEKLYFKMKKNRLTFI